MKTKPFFYHLALLTSIAFSTSLRALEVHEWGTFTILVSSRGQTVNWYQPYSDAAKLPNFVNLNNPMLMKSRVPFARVRMETPVIYFYPEKEMDISVRVAFADGSITERFPTTTNAPAPSHGMILSSGLNSIGSVTCGATQPTSEQIFEQRMREFSANTPPAIARWTGRLLSPNHKNAELIPAVAAQQGENYAAARNVPNAWLFRSDAPNQIIPGIHPIEKFIFYRGAGQALPPYSVSMPDDNSVTFSSHSQSASTFQIALKVKDGKASWIQMPNLDGPAKDAKRSSTISFPEKTISLEQADQELRSLFLTELTQNGLTKAEAQAMIDTWNHTWFAEPGQRVFTIVDKGWVNSVLPLAISPEPKKTERVFVARYEVLSPSSENELTEIITKRESGKITDLNLGRFSNGAAEIIAENIKQKFLGDFHQIQTARK